MMYQKTWLRRKCNLVVATLLMVSLAACEGEQAKTNSGENPQASTSGRLNTITKRGSVICGVNGQLPGFSFVDEKGEYSGMDVDLCRAIAAALFDDPSKVEFRDLSAQERFTAAQTGEVDVVNRNTTWNISRDTSSKMEFAPTTFYDTQGIMVSKASGAKEIKQLNGKSICILAGTTTEQNLADGMRKEGVTYNPLVFDDVDALYSAYGEGRCQAATSDRSQLAARRAILAKPDDHIILDVSLSKEPLGPMIADGDAAWFDAVKWITYALMEAEELGINSQNIATFQNSPDPNVKRFLGLEGKLGEDMGLPNDFAARIVKHVGNYSEIYDRNIGKPFGLKRGLNSLWKDGGLLYSPPFR
jgi:general L-amino acid transport system substrate-binding protein